MNLKTFITVTHERKRYANRPKIVCNDGFEMSVQGSTGHYCEPRDNTEDYVSMEIGFPTEEEELLFPLAEDDTNPTQTVYGWVPVGLIEQVIVKHEGINWSATLKNGTSC